DAVHRGGIVQTGPEGGDVELQLARIAEQAVAVERLLVLEQLVVVLPEPAEASGTLCRRGRAAGVGMELLLQPVVARAVERVVAEDELHVRSRADQLAQVAERVPAG